MNRSYKVFLSCLFVLTVIFVLVMRWLDHPLPQYEGQKVLQPLKKKVDVYTDEFGVPHVFADNESDLFFTAGYIAARDRMFQLSMVSLAVEGKLASVLGKKYLSTDIYLRTWRIHEIAKKLILNMSPENRAIFEAFCKGINYRIDEIENDPPIEFKILNFKAPDWNPVTVAGYARLMAHEMSGSWKPEIVFGAIESFYGKEKLAELMPQGETDLPTISEWNTKGLKPFYDKVIKEEYLLRDFFGERTADLGSNNWVISGDKTDTGMPYLANDPHLAYTQPPRWYEIHLKGGRFNVSGVCIAGIPMPVIGQNEKTAWGFTNTMVDDLDFFIEEINPNGKKQYRHDNKWRDVKETKEIISVKDEGDTTIIIRETHHGPIISDIHPLLKKGETVMSMAWTGHWVTSEMDAWISLTTMENWYDFSKALEMFGVPGQNIVYGDTEGNIGWRPAVHVPIRREGFSMLPRPGNNSDYDWRGKVPYEEMPFLYNPENGIISTANNRTIDEEFPYYISGLWADPSRAKRIKNRLNQEDLLTLDDMKSIQLDQTNEFAKEVVPLILDRGAGKYDVGTQRAVKFLKEWNFVEDVNSEAGLVFHTFISELIKNIYKDEMELIGDEYYKAYAGLKYMTNRKLREILRGEYSSWVDDIGTVEKIETIDDLVVRSLNGAYQYIAKTYGDNWSNWKWGDAHSLTHKHTLGDIAILDYLLSLDVGPYRSGGSEGSPNAGGYSRHKPFKQTSGASMRRIVDFSNMDETQFILPTGQSGLPNSPHYSDQAALYHSGEYRVTRFDEDKIKKRPDFRHLELLPD